MSSDTVICGNQLPYSHIEAISVGQDQTASILVHTVLTHILLNKFKQTTKADDKSRRLCCEWCKGLHAWIQKV